MVFWQHELIEVVTTASAAQATDDRSDMGTLDEIRASFGDDFFDRKTTSVANRHTWRELCICGHHDGFHSPTVGGSYRLRPDGTRTVGGKTFTTVHLFNGCVGALPPRGADLATVDTNQETLVSTETVTPTCPCSEFRPVIKVDRPNRYFNQRMPTDRSDQSRHPLMLGIKAFSTHLSRRKAADPERGGDPAWATAEFERRFSWLPGKRMCGMSSCYVSDETVWPVFVDGDRSELRCAKHRP
jgi:hypothetical protein